MFQIHQGLAVALYYMSFNLFLGPVEQLLPGKQEVWDPEKRLTWITMSWVLNLTWK